MGKRVQTFLNDKNYEVVKNVILNKDLVGYDGNNLISESAVVSYFVDLGIRVYLSSKDSKSLNLNEYRYELYKKILQNYTVTKGIINYLNELPEFEGRNLMKEINDTEGRNIINELSKLFKDQQE